MKDLSFHEINQVSGNGNSHKKRLEAPSMSAVFFIEILSNMIYSIGAVKAPVEALGLFKLIQILKKPMVG